MCFATLPEVRAQRLNTDSLEVLLTHSTDTTRIRILNQLAHEHRVGDREQSLQYATGALNLSRQIGFRKGEAWSLFRIGTTYGFKNDFDKALEFLLEAQHVAADIEDWNLAGDNSLNIGGIYSSRSNTKKAFESYMTCLSYFEKANNKSKIASALYAIGNTYTQEKKYQQALEYYNRSIAQFEELNERREIPKVLVNIGNMYHNQMDYANALTNFTNAIELFAEYKNERGGATALQSRAETYFVMNDFDRALTDLNASMVLNEKNNHEYNKVKCTLLFAKIYHEKKEFYKAAQNLERCIEIAKKIKLTRETGDAYRLLAEINSDQGNYKNAFEFLKLYRVYYDSVFDKEKSRQIQELQISYETVKKENEIKDLKNKEVLNRAYLVGSILLSVLIVFIAFLVLNRQRLKIKTEKALTEKENQLLEERKALIEADLANRKLNEERLRQEIDFKNKELTTYTLNLIQKNEVLENIKLAVDDIRNADDAQIRSKLSSLINTVNYSFHLDKDWENFKIHFEQVHQSYFDKLRHLFPDLSANDMKLCALIRLNLDTKETAAVLDISPESAKVARHRLRKKLNLSSDQNLAAYLGTI